MVFFVFYVFCSQARVVCAKARCASAGLTLSAKALVVGYLFLLALLGKLHFCSVDFSNDIFYYI